MLGRERSANAELEVSKTTCRSRSAYLRCTCTLYTLYYIDDDDDDDDEQEEEEEL